MHTRSALSTSAGVRTGPAGPAAAGRIFPKNKFKNKNKSNYSEMVGLITGLQHAQGFSEGLQVVLGS